MSVYQVTWIADVECEGDYKAAAQLAADRYFLPRIAAGEHGSACTFEVVNVADRARVVVEIDLADSLSELVGDDTL